MFKKDQMINKWLNSYLEANAKQFTDKRYETRTIMFMKIFIENYFDLKLRRQTLISFQKCHSQFSESDVSLMYNILIDFIDYLIKGEKYGKN